MKRPEHATDCPACDGWIGGAELLCVRCTDRVHRHMPDIYIDWLEARADAVKHATDSGVVAAEAYYRGFIVGTAKALFEKRWPRKAAGKTKTIGTEEEYRLTPKGRALINRKKGAAS